MTLYAAPPGRYVCDVTTSVRRSADLVLGGIGRTAIDGWRALADVRTWGPGLLLQMRRLGADSIPIALFIAVFTGIVLALLAQYVFTGAIPMYFVGTLVGKAILLELGPVLTGMALAGRVGANIAAELGTMRVTEQVDALETLAYDPLAFLVTPRVLAGILMFPVITVFSITIGIVAGWLTALVMLDMNTPEFVKGLRLFFDDYDVTFALIKAWSFGLVVTGVGCFYGFHTHGGAEGVGKATTRSVVIGSMIILVLDAFWAATLLNG